MTHAQQRAPFKVEVKADRKPYKPKPWSHQDELIRLKGKVVEVVVDAGSGKRTVVGILMNCDQFTLQIAEEERETPPELFEVRTLFKHAITSYKAVRQ